MKVFSVIAFVSLFVAMVHSTQCKDTYWELSIGGGDFSHQIFYAHPKNEKSTTKFSPANGHTCWNAQLNKVPEEAKKLRVNKPVEYKVRTAEEKHCSLGKMRRQFSICAKEEVFNAASQKSIKLNADGTEMAYGRFTNNCQGYAKRMVENLKSYQVSY